MIGFSVSSGKVSIANRRGSLLRPEPWTQSAALVQFNRDSAQAFVGVRANLLDPFDAFQGFLDSYTHTPSSTSSGAAAPRYGTLMLMTGISISGNDLLAACCGSVTRPARMIKPHKKVGRDVVSSANQAIIGFMMLRAPRLFLSRVSTSIPSIPRCSPSTGMMVSPRLEAAGDVNVLLHHAQDDLYIPELQPDSHLLRTYTCSLACRADLGTT